MICPECQTDDPAVYIGFSAVDCPNHQCMHYVGSSGQWKSMSTDTGMIGAMHFFSETTYITVMRLMSLDSNVERWGAYYFEDNRDITGGVAATPQRALEMLAAQPVMKHVVVPAYDGTK